MNIKRSLTMICFVLITALLSGCSNLIVLKNDNELIEDRINQFVKVYNDGDYNGILECMEPKVRNMYKSMSNIGEAVIGKSGLDIGLSDIFGVAVGMSSSGDLINIGEIKISNISDSRAEAKTTLSYNSDNNFGNVSQEVCFVMVKEDNDWFINDLK